MMHGRRKEKLCVKLSNGHIIHKTALNLEKLKYIYLIYYKDQ